MRVSVLINSRAGSVNENLIQKKVKQALFRCELHFSIPKTITEMEFFIHHEIEQQTDALVVCGGDGTINAVLQCLMPLLHSQVRCPSLCIISSGTANDLAFELGVHQKIQWAARALLEGKPKNVDVIEIESSGERKYMITCGGIGVPARTADLANLVRGSLQRLAEKKDAHSVLRFLSHSIYQIVKSLGASIYSLLLFYAFAEWEQDRWEIEIENSSGTSFKTRSSFIFVNNQPSLGSNFFPAPYTANDDGLVNILVIPVAGWFSLFFALFQIQRGNVTWSRATRSLDLSEVVIRDAKNGKNLCFFGDGEILFSKVNELKIRCLKKALPFVIKA